MTNTAAITAEEYRPHDLPAGWSSSPEREEETWLTKATETAYYNTLANTDWQLSYFHADEEDPELNYSDARKLQARLLHKNPAFLAEKVFQKELEDKARQIREKYGIGKLQVSGDTRYLSDDLMRLLAIIVRPTSEKAYRFLLRECLRGAEIFAPQPEYPLPEQVTILRNPHISRNEEALVTPLKNVGPIRKKYLSHLYYVAMVDSRSLIPDRLGGADYDGDTVHVYAEPLLCDSIRRNYEGGLENADNLPLLKIPSAEPLIADARDWHARFETVRSTFSSRVGQISNAALRRSILAYDEATPEELREQYRKRRCAAYRHMKPSGNYRKDVQRILFAQDRENGISVDELYQTFEWYEAYQIRRSLAALRESDWQFTPSEDREPLLYTILGSHLPPTKEVLCNFRSGGYRLLGDILMDLDKQNQDTAMRKYKGILKDDTAQMKSMMLGVMESQDYRQTLIRNCKSIIWPTMRHYSGEVLEQIDWADAVMCAEALGKRDFILDVLPAAALDLVIDRTAPEKKERGESLAERVGRILGLHRVS